MVTPIVTYMINEKEIVEQYSIQKLSAAKIACNMSIDKKTVYRVLKVVISFQIVSLIY